MPFQPSRVNGATFTRSGPSPPANADDAARRFKLSLIFTLPLILASLNHARLAHDWSTFMVICGGAQRLDIGYVLNGWLQLALASPVVLWLALPIFKQTMTSIGNRRLDATSAPACLLIAVPFLYSVFVLVKFTLISPPNAGAITLFFPLPAAFSTGFWLSKCLKTLGKSPHQSAKAGSNP
jgi:cation transport ATPase